MDLYPNYYSVFSFYWPVLLRNFNVEINSNENRLKSHRLKAVM